MTDYLDEEQQTDDLIDAWREHMPPLTQDEIDATLSAQPIDRISDAEPIQPDISGAAA